MHPDDTVLIAWCDRRLSPARSVRISLHVERCARCRDAVERANRNFRDVADDPALPLPPDSDEGLAAVLWAAREWQASSGPQAALERRVAAEVETYLGSGAAGLLGSRAEEGGPELVRASRSALSIFLGCEAGRALLERTGASNEAGEAAVP